MFSLKNLLTCIFAFFLLFAQAQNNNNALHNLQIVISQKKAYTKRKELAIAQQKSLIKNTAATPENFRLNRLLYFAYEKFQIDSAVSYANKNMAIASFLGRPELLVTAKLDLANIYFPLNKFLEADDLLKSISPRQLPKVQLTAYYSTKAEFYEHYLANIQNDEYRGYVNRFQDSLLKLCDPKSINYEVIQAVREINLGYIDEARTYLIKIQKTKDPTTPVYAMVTYLLGFDYEKSGDIQNAIFYYATSAALDAQFAIKDNASMQELALLLYKAGDIDHAYQCTQSAIEDALYCDSKFRTLHMSQLYSIINTAYLKKEANQKSQLQLYLVFISILTFILAAIAFYVYKQMKRESNIKRELDLSTKQLLDLNTELSEANLRLNETNSLLTESNKIKEVYIAQFFDLCSAYINKLENFRKVLNKKANEKHLDELLRMLRSTCMVNDEVDQLYKIFDEIFLRLYPTFISEFNSLLLPEYFISVKPGELLNTELRVYALIRLGITDSGQIASFLRYSLTTIYNYRTKARNKASGARDRFEENVMKIGLISSK